jgi:uncharacterized membrane protein
VNGELWTDVHGGATHFPIALAVGAFCCEAAGLWFWSRPAGARLRSAGAYAVWTAALGSLAAVVSGLLLARGEMRGAGALRWHHRFAWPAFVLLVGAASWRALVHEAPSRRVQGAYVALLGAAAALVLGAGYWGGELLKAFP